MLKNAISGLNLEFFLRALNPASKLLPQDFILWLSIMPRDCLYLLKKPASVLLNLASRILPLNYNFCFKNATSGLSDPRILPLNFYFWFKNATSKLLFLVQEYCLWTFISGSRMPHQNFKSCFKNTASELLMYAQECHLRTPRIPPRDFCHSPWSFKFWLNRLRLWLD